MSYKRVVVVPTDELCLDGFWDKKQPLVVQYPIKLLIAAFQSFRLDFSSLVV